MISLTPAEERLREFLITLAAEADPADPRASAMSYGEMVDAVDPDGSLGWKQGKPRCTRLIHALYHVNKYEAEHGRPMVGAFAVSSGHRTSGNGFAYVGREVGRQIGEGRQGEDEFWLSELTTSAEYWSATRNDKGQLPDAQFDTIMAELSKIKQMIRQLLHT